MKKKFFAIYALVGALVASPVFTSCVDDEESPSVTAIRDAKTAELKSIAALKKAEAQAQATLDAANIALKAAQADAQLAAAKLAEAEAALQETQNEAQAVALLVQKKEAEKQLAAIQAEMEKQAVIIEAALLNAQADLLEAKKQLDQATKNYDAQEKAELQRLANAYYNAVNGLLNAKKSLLSLENELAFQETGLADAKAGLEKTIAQYNQNIEYYKIKIDQYKQYTNYSEDIDALKLERVKAQGVADLAWDKYNTLNQAYWDAQNEVDTEKLAELKKAIEEDAFYQFTINSQYYDAETESYNHFSYFNWDFAIAIERDHNWDWVLNGTYGSFSLKYEYGDYTYFYGDSISYEFEYAADMRKKELEFAQYIDPIKANIKAAEEAIKADEASLKTAETAATAAKKAWDEAEEADKYTKEQEYRAALNTVLGLQNAIKNNQDNLKAWNRDLTIWTGAWDMLKNAETLEAALQEKIKAYNDANEAAYAPVVEAWKAVLDADLACQEANAAVEAINTLLNGDGYNQGAESLANRIKNYESNIEYYQNQIEEAKKLLSSWNGQQMTFEDVIAWYKAQIEAQKAIVAAMEVAVADAKAALDAAMPAEEEEGTEEETPAE